MNVSPDLAVTEELVRICQEVTDANADKDSWENIARLVKELISTTTFYMLSCKKNPSTIRVPILRIIYVEFTMVI